MKCIYCGYEETKVNDSRATVDAISIRRRRECLKCGRRFTTYETVETTPILVIKSDGSRQPFDRQKIKKGIIKACEKRSVSMEQIDHAVNEIEKEICNNLNEEVKSQLIGEKVMKKLKEIDEVAYVRFASVYRKFEDVTNFKQFLEQFLN